MHANQCILTSCLLQVEPFQRSLKDLDVDVMINGRRRDHGFERAQLEVRRRWDSLLVAARGRSLLLVCCGLLPALTRFALASLEPARDL